MTKTPQPKSKRSFLALVTFDLHRADPGVYKKVKEELGQLKLRKYLKNQYGENKSLPHNIFAATYRADDERSVEDLRDTLRDELRERLETLGLSYTIFVAVARNEWAATRALSGTSKRQPHKAR